MKTKTPWAVILCKFSDDYNYEPFSMQYYKNLFTTQNTGSQWNMIKYFSDYSHGLLDLTGTKIFGWYNLTQSVHDYNDIQDYARLHLLKWARKAATDNGVDLTPFYSTVVCTNLWKDIGAGLGSSPEKSVVVAQGEETVHPWGLSHEMGHVYGLWHSRIEGSDADYQDRWDTMSAFNVYPTTDPEYDHIGPGLNAWNMRSRGWLDETRVWKGGNYSYDETVVLRPLVRHDLPGNLAAELPGGYLAEFRVREGWDGGIPRPAVLIHRFENSNSYLIPGNSGGQDLVAGDSFGHIPSVLQNPELPSSCMRVDVTAIDAAANEATLRIRYWHSTRDPHLAVDPMSLILKGRAYLVWAEQHHPHVPKVADIVTLLQKLTPEERRDIAARAKTLTDYGKLFEQALAEVAKNPRK